jgi:hypothetical protein
MEPEPRNEVRFRNRVGLRPWGERMENLFYRKYLTEE